jgi:hypothetical protein
MAKQGGKMKKILIISDSEKINRAVEEFFRSQKCFLVEMVDDLMLGFSALVRHNLIDAMSKTASAKIFLTVIDAEIKLSKKAVFESVGAMLQETKRHFGFKNVPLPKIIIVASGELSAEQKRQWTEFNPEVVIKGEGFPLRLYQKISELKEGKDGQSQSE